MNQYTAEDFNVELGNILLAHEYNYRPGFSYENYAGGRGFCGVILACSGSVVYKSSGDTLTLTAGQIAFIPARTAYTVSNDGTEDFSHYTVNFDVASVSPENGFVSALVASQSLCILNTDNLPMYHNLFEKLTAVWSDKRPGYRMAAKAVVCELMFNFLTEYYAQNTDFSVYDRILPAKRYIDEYFAREVTIGELADMCGMSDTNFRRRFKDVCGVSPIEYRAQIRVTKAKELLLCRFYSIDEVARMTGFPDANYFSRCFRRRTGMSPNRYRRTF